MVSVLQEAVSKSEMDDVRLELPREFKALVEAEDHRASPSRDTRIQERAYELYLQRGRVPGHAL